MLDQWKNNANYKGSSARNKRNRASKGTNGTSRYAGGCRSVVQNVDETEKKIGRRMTQDELMSMMYHSRKKGKWMGDRPQKDMDRFNKLCIEWKESHPEEEMTQDQINKLWLIATGGEGKGRIPGQGSLYRKMDNVLNPAAPAPSVQPSPASLSSAQVRSSSVPIPTPLLPSCVSPTPRVASPSGYESSIEARMQRQDELIERLIQRLHQPGQQHLDTNRSHIIMPSTTMASSNMSFQPTPSPSISFRPMPGPSSSMSFQPMPVPSSSMSFQAMPTSNMSYQALLQSTEPNVYGDMSAGRFAPSGGAYGDGTTRQS